MIRPTVFGYLRVRRMPTELPQRSPGARKALEEFAEREGFALAQVFIDTGDTRPYTALHGAGLPHRGRRFTDVAAVLVLDYSHLGTTPTAQAATHHRLNHASLPVVALTCTDLSRSRIATHPAIPPATPRA